MLLSFPTDVVVDYCWTAEPRRNRTCIKEGHGFWPNVTQSDEEPFADKFNGCRRWSSQTLKSAPWVDGRRRGSSEAVPSRKWQGSNMS